MEREGTEGVVCLVPPLLVVLIIESALLRVEAVVPESLGEGVVLDLELDHLERGDRVSGAVDEGGGGRRSGPPRSGRR